MLEADSESPTQDEHERALPHVNDAAKETDGGYWLTRFAILRLLGFVYFFAFLSLACQVLPLIGSDGLLPAKPKPPATARDLAAALADLPHPIGRGTDKTPWRSLLAQSQ